MVLKKKNITKQDIDDVCVSIADRSLELDDACLVNHIDPDSFKSLMRKKREVRESIKIAESKKIENLIALVKTGRNNARQLLESIVPHYNKTFKLQLQYVNRAVLHIVKKYVTDEQYFQIVRDLAEQPERELLARIDNEVER